MHSIKKFLKKESGITLIESIVVLFVISIFLGVVHFSFTSSEIRRLNSASKMLTDDIRYVQRKALNENVQHEIYFDVLAKKYYVLKTNPNGLSDTIEEKDLPEEIFFRHTMLSSGSAFSKSNLIFTKRGTPKKAGTIELGITNSKSTYYLDLTISVATGNVNKKEIKKIK